MDATAVVLEQPEDLRLRLVQLQPAGEEDVVVETRYSGISTGTERLLYTGEMPPFPGMGYPLVPGYESVGVVRSAGKRSGREVGQEVFVPGARCFEGVHGLFGGAASQLIVPGSRVLPLPSGLGEQGVLLALAATACHALRGWDGELAPCDLIVGHGVLGRLIARIVVALGFPAPVVWEQNEKRRDPSPASYQVTSSAEDERADYARICDASGSGALLDLLISRLRPQGEVVLAGFYSEPLSFTFPPAFMREARLQIAAQWQPDDLRVVCDLIAEGTLSLDCLITHRCRPDAAEQAYITAFGDPECLKMVLDWRANNHG